MMDLVNTKLFKEMNIKEQLDYITDLTTFANEKLPRLEKLGDAWEAADRKDFETGLRLVGAFAYAREYCNQSLFQGDFSRRVARINYYLNRIKKELANGNTLRGANGELLAFVPGMKVTRRRGRPTKEEAAKMAAEKAGEAQLSAEQEKAVAIAKLLGIETVTDNPQREKTDAEKVAEIEAKKKAEADAAALQAQQQDLFSQIGAAVDAEKAAASNAENASDDNKAGDDDKSNFNEINQEDPAKFRLPLQQVKPYLSSELAAKVDTVRELRATFASNSERAKILAEQGAKPEDVAPYAQSAHDLNDEIENIYEAVDRELAMVYGRLRDDEQYSKDFALQHKLKDIEPLKKSLKVYYDKMPATFAQEVENVIRESNPEVIAAKEQAAANKAAADKIIKYLTRKDSLATPKRLDTMTKRMEELKALIGEEAAEVYMPYLNKCREEVEKQKVEKQENE